MVKGIVGSSSPNTKMISLSFSKKLYMHQNTIKMHTVQIRKWKRLFTIQLLESSTDYVFHVIHNLTFDYSLLETMCHIGWSNSMVPLYTEHHLLFLWYVNHDSLGRVYSQKEDDLPKCDLLLHNKYTFNTYV